MDIFTLFDIALQALVFLAVFYILHDKGERDNERLGNLLDRYSQNNKETLTSFMEGIGNVESKHWEQLEKQSTKQLQILEKQTKDFIGVMGEFIEASKPVPVPFTPDLSLQDLRLDKNEKMENSIEKEEIPEQNLEDVPRIPMVDGVNVQFEGDEEIFPINIT